MNRQNTVKWLALLGIVPEGEQRGKWVTIRCPFAMWRHDGEEDNNPSFGISLAPGDSGVHCFSCQYGGTMSGMALELMMLNKQYDLGWKMDIATALSVLEDEEAESPLALADFEVEEKEVDHIWPEEWLDSFVKASENEEAMTYMDGRDGGRCPIEVMDRLDLKFDWDHKRICFPIRGADGKLRGMQGRATDGREPKYYLYSYQGHRSSNLWIGEEHLDFDKPVVLVEGGFDEARVMQSYRNVVSGLGAGLNPGKAKRLQLATHIVTMYDVGAAGDQARKKASQLFKGSVQHLMPPEGRSDPGESSAYEVALVLEEAGLELDDIWI